MLEKNNSATEGIKPKSSYVTECYDHLIMKYVESKK